MICDKRWKPTNLCDTRQRLHIRIHSFHNSSDLLPVHCVVVLHRQLQALLQPFTAHPTSFYHLHHIVTASPHKPHIYDLCHRDTFSCPWPTTEVSACHGLPQGVSDVQPLAWAGLASPCTALRYCRHACSWLVNGITLQEPS